MRAIGPPRRYETRGFVSGRCRPPQLARFVSDSWVASWFKTPVLKTRRGVSRLVPSRMILLSFTALPCSPRYWLVRLILFSSLPFGSKLGSDARISPIGSHSHVRSRRFGFHRRRRARAAIRAAVRYLLEGAAGSDRGDIAREIIEIVNEVARGLPPGGQDPLDDGLPDPFDDAPGG
jgi:hypothetical protein